MVLAVLILYFGIEYLKGINVFKDSNYYYTTFTDIKGLAQSAPVTLNGYKVGLVREISYEYDNPGHVRVELGLDPKLKVPQGTQACLDVSLLGTASVVLKLGDKAQGYYRPGDTLPGVETPGMLDAVSTELMPGVVGLMPKIDSLLTVTTRLAASPALASSLQRLDNVMANLETSTSLLNQGMQTFPQIATGANATMANVQELSKNLKQMSYALNDVADDLKNAHLDSTAQRINAIAANLEQATAQLNSTNGTLGLMLNDPALYNHVNAAASMVDSILIDLRCHPKRYIPPIKVF